jgi:uncharacterized membrane protein
MSFEMNDVTLARAIHVLAIVLWIGGVGLVTTVLLPAVRRFKMASATSSGVFITCLRGSFHDGLSVIRSSFIRSLLS